MHGWLLTATHTLWKTKVQTCHITYTLPHTIRLVQHSMALIIDFKRGSQSVWLVFNQLLSLSQWQYSDIWLFMTNAYLENPVLKINGLLPYKWASIKASSSITVYHTELENCPTDAQATGMLCVQEHPPTRMGPNKHDMTDYQNILEAYIAFTLGMYVFVVQSNFCSTRPWNVKTHVLHEITNIFF